MKINDVIKDWQLNAGVSENDIRELLSSITFKLPEYYISFLRLHDGGEGFVGENYLILWRAAELIPFNQEYEVSIYAPGLFLFGSNGGGEGYGFNLLDATLPIISVPFVGMEQQYAKPAAKIFSGLFAESMG